MNRKFFTLNESLFLIFIIIIPVLSVFLWGLEQGLSYLGKYYLFLLFVALIAFLSNIVKTVYGHIIISSKKKHNIHHADTAIIIGNNDFFCLKHWIVSSYAYKFRIFFKYLELKNIKYSVYDNLNKSQFDKILRDNKIKSVYLFGHGTRHAFGLYQDKPIYYCDYKNKGIKKDFIAQYHCNHGFGNSLADYVVSDKNMKKLCNVTTESWSQSAINRFLKEEYEEELKKLKLERGK